MADPFAQKKGGRESLMKAVHAVEEINRMGLPELERMLKASASTFKGRSRDSLLRAAGLAQHASQDLKAVEQLIVLAYEGLR